MRLEIRDQGVDLGQGLRKSLERRVRFMLARFCSRIDRVTVRLENLDGTIGGMKVRCRIVIRLAPFGQVSVDVAAVDLDVALNWAANRIRPAVDRELFRWRHKKGMPST
jgi:predicted component of type VI protein secretion system